MAMGVLGDDSMAFAFQVRAAVHVYLCMSSSEHIIWHQVATRADEFVLSRSVDLSHLYERRYRPLS